MFRNHILIIDDEPDTVDILRFALERAGYEVSVIGSAADALPMATNNDVSLVLLDLVLNDGNGLDICRELRACEQTRTLPIILVTGKLRTEFNTVEGFKAGADDYIMKPFRPAELVARVDGLLERTRRLRDASRVTGLPGPVVIQDQLSKLLRSESAWAVLYVDIVGFTAFNRISGFDRGDDLLRALAALLTKVAQVDSNDFIGHTGGDAFIVTTLPQHMEGIATALIAEFDEVVSQFHTLEAISKGTFTLIDRRGLETTHPVVALAIAGISNELRAFRNPLEIAATATELKRALRTRPGCNYLKDRRTDRSY